MPLAIASAMAGLSASGLDGLMSRMLTFFAIRSRMSASWPAASVSRVVARTLLILPDVTAWALAEQIIASRQPLPTAPGFEMPTVYLPAAAEPPGAVLAPALEPALEQ